MLKIYMQTWMNTWLAKVNSLIHGTAGTKDHVLYVNNQNGDFKFDKGYAVISANIIVTDGGTDSVRAKLLELPEQLGYTYYNQATRAIVTYNTTNSAWESNTAGYSTAILPGRFYYSPWNQTVWYTTSYGALKRYRSNLPTLIG